MSTQYSTLPERTAKPVVAGIFNICSGAGCLLGVLGMLIGGIIFLAVGEDAPKIVGIVIMLCSLPLAVIGILSLVGVVFLSREKCTV